MKRASALEPEYLILGLLNQQPDHGYELHRRVITEQAGLWHLPQNQVYNLLKRLEARGDISSEELASDCGPKRRIYRLTRRGRDRFRRWQVRPTPISARALRLAFLTRLGFALAEDRQGALRIMEAQEAALQDGLQRLRRKSDVLDRSASLACLSMDLRIRQLETTLTWLEDCRNALGLRP